MLITDEKKLMDIQTEFNNKFPALKLEFFSKHHEEMEGSPNSYKLDPNKTIAEVRKTHAEGDLSINGHQKVSTLESNFYEKYGLNVQVYRKSKDLWLQTIATDEWTLTEQNTYGEKSTEPVTNEDFSDLGE